MKEIKIEFEKYDGTFGSFIKNCKDGEMYILQMLDVQHDNIKIMVCEIHQTMNSLIGVANGHFLTDYKEFMKIIGICKIVG